MQFIKIKTRKFLPPKDDIYKLFEKYLPPLKENDILIITSKILAIHQGRCVKISKENNKDGLVMGEAEKYVPKKINTASSSLLTIKNHTLVHSSGIDESNGNGYYILRPRRIDESAKEIYNYLKKKFKIKNFGLIITDSVSTPFHYGAMGKAVGFYGFEPLRDYRGKKDIFGRKMKFERANVVDPLAAIGVFLIGEAGERTPMLIIRGIDSIKFTNRNTRKKLFIPEKKDRFKILFKDFINNKNK